MTSKQAEKLAQAAYEDFGLGPWPPDSQLRKDWWILFVCKIVRLARRFRSVKTIRVKRAVRGRPPKIKDVAEIRKMRKAGMLYEDIAAQTKLSIGTIHRILKKGAH